MPSSFNGKHIWSCHSSILFLNPSNPKSTVTGLHQRWGLGACGGGGEVSHDEKTRFANWSTSLLEKLGGWYAGNSHRSSCLLFEQLFVRHSLFSLLVEWPQLRDCCSRAPTDEPLSDGFWDKDYLVVISSVFSTLWHLDAEMDTVLILAWVYFCLWVVWFLLLFCFFPFWPENRKSV